MPNWFRSKFAIFVFALLLRLGLCWNVLYTTPLPRFWRVSEPAAVAESILDGHGFASPYDRTQPSAWIAPVYPAAVVVPVFRVFGAYSPVSTFLLVGLNALFSALAAVVIFELGKRVLGVNGGATAAWLWAACLPSAVVPLLVWDTSLSALIFAIAFLLTVSLESSSSYWQWGSAGLFWAFACLVNPALISPVPFLALVLWFRERRQGKNLWKQITLSLVLSVAVVSPWLIRNYRVFGTPVFVRSNYSAELYFGNLGFASHPLGPSREYQQLGELSYVAQKQRAVEEYIRGNAKEFSERSVRRAISFWVVPKISGLYWLVVSVLCWFGLGLLIRERSRSALPLLIVVAVYPLPYYISYIFEKYRHPIEPIMFVLAAYPVLRVAELASTKISNRKGRAEHPRKNPDDVEAAKA